VYQGSLGTGWSSQRNIPARPGSSVRLELTALKAEESWPEELPISRHTASIAAKIISIILLHFIKSPNYWMN
jgi:hypothetical protein